MSDLNYVFIRNLTATVPDHFVHETMRKDFTKIVSQCKVTERLLSNDFEQPLTGDQRLVPVAYNLIVDALENPALLNKLQENAQLLGYWFFNVFISPPLFTPLIPIEINPITGVDKGVTKGVDQTSEE